MKQYILSAELKVTDEDIRNARIWEKRKNLNYKDNVAHLLVDYMADGEPDFDIEMVELNEIKQTQSEFSKIVNTP